MSVCKKCDARILWAQLDESTKMIPIDPRPVPGGPYLVYSSHADLPALATKPSPMPDKARARFTCHLDTCPKRTARGSYDPTDPGPREP